MIVNKMRGYSPSESIEILGGGLVLGSEIFGCLSSKIWDIEEELYNYTGVCWFLIGSKL